MNRLISPSNTLFRAFATLFAIALFTGCACEPIKVPSPPEIIRVPQYMPLPVDCGIVWPVDLPAGSSAADVMLTQREALDAYKDQVNRCYGASNGG